jgi:hypothetical protein
MKENFFNSMFSEGGKISHKRWISVTVAGILCWCIVFATVMAKTADERKSLIVATMVFILLMSGVATVPQILRLVKGDKIEEKKDA